MLSHGASPSKVPSVPSLDTPAGAQVRTTRRVATAPGHPKLHAGDGGNLPEPAWPMAGHLASHTTSVGRSRHVPCQVCDGNSAVRSLWHQVTPGEAISVPLVNGRAEYRPGAALQKQGGSQCACGTSRKVRVDSASCQKEPAQSQRGSQFGNKLHTCSAPRRESALE